MDIPKDRPLQPCPPLHSSQLKHYASADCAPTRQTCPPNPHTKTAAPRYAALHRQPVSCPRPTPAFRQFPGCVATNFPRCNKAPAPGCERSPCSTLPPCAPLRPRCERPCGSRVAIRPATRPSCPEFRCCTRNQAEPASRRYKVSRCDRSRDSPLRRDPFSEPHSSSAPALSGTTPAPDIPTALPGLLRAHIRFRDTPQIRKPRQTGSCCSPTLRRPSVARKRARPH